jgi:alpha-galactosidase
MADYGYMYVNIDDGWSKKEGDEPYRNYCGNILPNEKFPDMERLTEYIHSKGLRAGIYTSPGPLTCGKYVGSYQHEQIDAQQFAKWGFDFLKYDWCSYRHRAIDETVYEYRKPYALMGQILQNLNRDIVFNLCQYGMSNVWEWGDEVGSHAWRTDGDIGRMFFMVSAFRALYARDGSGIDLSKYAGPGNWNDPDYILIGQVSNRYTIGLGEDRNRRHHNARDLLFNLSGVVFNDVYEDGKGVSLTPNQQYQYMSLWSLMASPLIFSGDMTNLDDFTLNVLCNPEIIAVNQDYPGKQGTIVKQTSDYFIIVKPLADGSVAMGLFSTCYGQQMVKVSWKELGIQVRQSVRDLWRQRDIGKYEEYFMTSLPRHGVMMVRLISE